MTLGFLFVALLTCRESRLGFGNIGAFAGFEMVAVVIRDGVRQGFFPAT
jgi:hypothetical protein